MPERPCDGCTMCCKLPAAPPPLNKPAGVWCRNCDKGHGCRIYEQRPQGCRDFQCLWKVMPDFPEELRPDRTKVLWTMTEAGTAVATTEYPRALETVAQRSLIEQFRRAGVAVIVREARRGVV
jgi:hypothetical protein